MMLRSIPLRAPGAPITLRISALAVLLIGAAGFVFSEMPPYEAGRLYLIALGLYLISPAETLEKGSRPVQLIRQNKRYLFGVLAITLAILLVALQFLAAAF